MNLQSSPQKIHQEVVEEGQKENKTPLEKLQPYFVDKPHPLMEAKTIQIVLLREALDYAVLRTEETRELNKVTTPLSVSQTQNELRVAFLASKQKAAESRQLEQMLRTAIKANNLIHVNRKGQPCLIPKEDKKEDDKVIEECYLKDNLCLSCPRCALYGGTSVEEGRGEPRANIKHRIEYSTAFSLMPFRDIGESITFNAIIDVTQTTGQALGDRFVVIPATVFPSIITLRSVTWQEFVLTIKTLLACHSYGAESRTSGDVRNNILGIVAGWEEIITPLELTLELYDKLYSNSNDKLTADKPIADKLNGEAIKSILESYKPLAGNKNQITIFTPQETKDIVEKAADTSLNNEFLDAVYKDVAEYRKVQLERAKKK
jgi:CRISPR type I-D-associated protein Csc2